MLLTLFPNRILPKYVYRNILQICCRNFHDSDSRQDNYFEPVYKLESIKYIALFNRFKIYHSVATGFVVPISAALEVLDVLPSSSFIVAAYLGATGIVLLSLGSFITKNVIGFLYITEDNKLIKVSIVDYWGKRRDCIMPLDDWIPIEELPSMRTKAFYFSPQLKDGTKLKLFISQGQILNKEKMDLL